MERLNKFLAHCGVASRRQAEQLILQGRVRRNGEVIRELGVQIDPTKDRIELDGKPLRSSSEWVYIILHKPPGYLTTVRDPFNRPTVMDLLPKTEARLYPVGRLDLDTSGLLFLTNDGDMALALTHPRHLVEKIYRVKVAGNPEPKLLEKLEQGIVLEDGPTAPARVAIENVEKGYAMVRVVLREGRKRQIKRMFKAIGHPVLELQRLAMGPLQLGDLPVGKFRVPTAAELNALQRLKAGLQNQGKHGKQNAGQGEDQI